MVALITATFTDRSFTIEGHAGGQPRGENILCAAVSAVGQMTAVGIEQELGLPARIERRDGRLAVDLEEADPRASLLIATLRRTLSILAGQYPDRIQVRGEPSCQ